MCITSYGVYGVAVPSTLNRTPAGFSGVDRSRVTVTADGGIRSSRMTRSPVSLRTFNE
jgi:hypothetical protein